MRVGVAGASGYVGRELLRYAASHPHYDVAVATAERHVGGRVASHAPSLAAAYPDLTYAATSPAALEGCELVFVALPHGGSAALVAALRATSTVVVDLGADLRLADLAAWATWYGTDHPAPELVGQAVYGLVERHRGSLKGASLVAVPGCYPTAAVLAMGPLLDAGLVGAGPVVVDAMSGASGAGSGLSDALHYPALADDVTAYGLAAAHRHTPEMEGELGRDVLFTPHLVPMDRGLLATCAAPASVGADTAAAIGALRDAYDREPFVVVTEDPPRPKDVRGTNVAHVTACVDPRTGWLRALCAIDNLGKGAAGQAIQCANVALGVAEEDGLALGGVTP
ncbi:MAG TPA: N-acetyl-gamma-glutamyl-phosphate reductase [Acidimicrobiales bacterium]|jgi:N-acetyl-gamma-glutamyl-phosphate reductase|nr:N-acetyl-gamma-glutamyl-phosphate reductase [Acidimicrobiales bacterium]